MRPADLGVDLSGVQQNDKPTRDVLVVFDNEGDREFVGFGSATNGEFADCFLEADKLPHDAIKVAPPVKHWAAALAGIALVE